MVNHLNYVKAFVLPAVIGAVITALVAFALAIGQAQIERASSDVTLVGLIHNYASTRVSGKARFPVYYNGKSSVLPLLELSLVNHNDSSIDIDEVCVEVTDFVPSDQFTIGDDAGGADLVPNIYYRCSIEPYRREYIAEMVSVGGEAALPTDTLISVRSNDTAELKIEMTPSETGLYTVRGKVNYKYDGQPTTAATSEHSFVYAQTLYQ